MRKEIGTVTNLVKHIAVNVQEEVESPTHSNLRIRWTWVVSHPPVALLHYPLNERLRGPQRRSRHRLSYPEPFPKHKCFPTKESRSLYA